MNSDWKQDQLLINSSMFLLRGVNLKKIICTVVGGGFPAYK